MPDAARTQDPAGVEAFVRYYLALINRTSQVMDAAPLRDLSRGCEDCDRIAAETEKVAAEGHAYRGGEITITDSAPATADGVGGEMVFAADQALLSVIDGSGQVIQDSATQPYTGLQCGAAVNWDAVRATWLMAQLTLG